MNRRLAAILAADIAGYSRLMGADETATLSALRLFRSDIFGPAVGRARGRIVKSMGDGWLVEFGSAADAVTCALEVQDRLAAHETIRLRIGVHLGDVTHEEEDVFGDGVNIAARLEALSAPGGIAISDAVRSSIDGVLRAGFADAGARRLKNIADPVRVWARAPDGAAPAAAAPAFSDRTSVAVLPFQSAASDPDHAALAEDLAEDVATELARFRWLHVVGEASGARYLVEGAVRRAGARLRVTAHLTSTADGRRLISERWDRDAGDLFAIQDELRAVIVSRVVAEIDAEERTLVRAKPLDSLTARELGYRANLAIFATGDENLAEAEATIERALAVDPDDAQAHVQKSVICIYKALSGRWPPREALEEGAAAARRAIALDPRTANAHSLLSLHYAVLGETDRALESAERARALNPNGWGAYQSRAMALLFAPPGWAADPAAIAERMVADARDTLRLAPNSPLFAQHICLEGIGLLLGAEGGDPTAAVVTLERAAGETGAPWWTCLFAAIGEVRRGREDAARRRVADLLRLAPGMTLTAIEAIFGATYVFQLWRAEIARLPDLGLPAG
ncbi:adenylate/guanylate cyclase domain-containing protein [Pikeienuella sp. HZG-20]|uniref:adenylate/guanylate cyclase domain-containing protein n=1 Tax=Paludibacillus litoralis TaxID=3133267 RepID=UPI0030EE720E